MRNLIQLSHSVSTAANDQDLQKRKAARSNPLFLPFREPTPLLRNQWNNLAYKLIAAGDSDGRKNWEKISNEPRKSMATADPAGFSLKHNGRWAELARKRDPGLPAGPSHFVAFLCDVVFAEIVPAFDSYAEALEMLNQIGPRLDPL